MFFCKLRKVLSYERYFWLDKLNRLVRQFVNNEDTATKFLWNVDGIQKHRLSTDCSCEVVISVWKGKLLAFYIF